MVKPVKFDVCVQSSDASLTCPSENELSLACSYFELFTRGGSRLASSTEHESGSLERHMTQESVSSSSRAEVTEDFDVWVEDSRTTKDDNEANQVLSEARERCQISHWNAEKLSDEQAWNRFYQHHQTNFFKDRHYLHKAFPNEFGGQPLVRKDAPDNIITTTTDICQDENDDDITTKQVSYQGKHLIEVGCGVGNAFLPLLENKDTTKWSFIQGLDLSSDAIEWVQKDERFIRAFKEHRALAHVCDISIPENLPIPCQGVADVTTLLFCLSAIEPSKMIIAAANVAATLCPGGVLVFRDYGRYDEAQMKLGTQRNKQLEDNFYRKHDGTKCYYFTLDDLSNIFEKQTGLETLELHYIRRVYKNRATNSNRRRVWVQARFRKPL